MELLIATSNEHKLREIDEVLSGFGIVVKGLGSISGSIPEPVEDGATFQENARIKAREYARATELRCLADDSGLEVDALDGAPGIYSARYAGEGGTRQERDEANNRKLLQQLQGVPQSERTARFVCALCLCEPDGTILHETRGEFPGTIIDTPRGANGFGYDPLLYVPELGATSAELEPEAKNGISHRGRALQQLVAWFNSDGSSWKTP